MGILKNRNYHIVEELATIIWKKRLLFLQAVDRWLQATISWKKNIIYFYIKFVFCGSASGTATQHLSWN